MANVLAGWTGPGISLRRLVGPSPGFQHSCQRRFRSWFGSSQERTRTFAPSRNNVRVSSKAIRLIIFSFFVSGGRRDSALIHRGHSGRGRAPARSEAGAYQAAEQPGNSSYGPSREMERSTMRMLVSIKEHEGLWGVYKDGVQVFSGEYSEVENWLDLVENSSQGPAPGQQGVSEPDKTRTPRVRPGRQRRTTTCFRHITASPAPSIRRTSTT